MAYFVDSDGFVSDLPGMPFESRMHSMPGPAYNTPSEPQEPPMSTPTPAAHARPRARRAPFHKRFLRRAGIATRMIPQPIRAALTWGAVAFIGLIIAAMICGAGLAAANKISEPRPSVSCR